MSTKWIQINKPLDQHPNSSLIHYYSRIFDLHPILVQYLYFHGIDNEEKFETFLLPSIEPGLHDPFLLNDMKKAVYRILKAVECKESILIFGDYDVDGITSTSILYLALKRFGANVSYRLPLREEGYGLSAQAMETVDENTSLIITVDNGTSSHEAMKVAKNKGIDVIVTDHHEVLGPHPQCYAFINPMRHDSMYPFTSLSGAGVALKVVQALYQTMNIPFDAAFFSYIELAALGTIADIMPIKEENRVICYLGLNKMNNNANPVFQTIFEKLNVKHIDSSTIGFVLGPIFNSCGRVSDPNIAVDILTSNEVQKDKVVSLIDLNTKRKQITKEHFNMAEEQILHHQLYNHKVIVVYGEFHNGIIGIVASRITEKYKKPAIVITTTGTGSARSVKGSGFSIINVIKKSSDFLLKYGGHQAASGLSILPDEKKIREFSHSIQRAAQSEAFREPSLTYVCKLGFHNFSRRLFEDVLSLEPYGINIPKPVFYSGPIRSSAIKLFGKNNEHIKLFYRRKEAIAFFRGSEINNISIGKHHHALYSPLNYHKQNFLIHSIRCKQKQ